MNRREAVNLLFKIYNACQDIIINSIQIDTMKNESKYPNQEFILLIKGTVSPSSYAILKIIAKNHNLEISEKSGITMISSPNQQNK